MLDQDLKENHRLINDALFILKDALRPFIEEKLKAKYDDWLNEFKKRIVSSRNSTGKDEINDCYYLLKSISDNKFWNDIFSKELDFNFNKLAIDIKDIRNDWAHFNDSDNTLIIHDGDKWKSVKRFTFGYTNIALIKISEFLQLINEHEAIVKIEKLVEKLIHRKNKKTVTESLYDAALERINEVCDLSSKHITGSYDNFSLERTDVYIPLGLVERQKRKIRRNMEDDSFRPESENNQSIEVIQVFEEAGFFDQILKDGKGKSNGKRIAIIGAPGSGKTTRLQVIADWLLNCKSEDQKAGGNLPIWISLGDLRGDQELDDYLFDKWLYDVCPREELLDDWRKVLKDLLDQGKLWLLIDGVDEMPINNPLHYIEKNLAKSWANKIRTVITCRINLWETNPVLAHIFEVFKNLDFKPNQIDNFILKSLGKIKGQELVDHLNLSGKERLRNLVRNPLRLTLLCAVWHQGDTLPDTQAELYRAFTQKIYDWKAIEICEKYRWQKSIDYDPLQYELNKALGEVAKQAIDSPTSRFRLEESFIKRIMDEFDPKLFPIAKDIGWLNNVGVSAKKQYENIYAFYHPTFQEYFAAIGIKEHNFFLNHIPNNPEQGTYRIFEAQWKEVYLLWMGNSVLHEDIATRNELLLKIYDFSIDCPIGEIYYPYSAIYMAAIGLHEFQQCNSDLLSDIFGFILSSRDENFSLESQPKHKKNEILGNFMRSALLETKDIYAIEAVDFEYDSFLKLYEKCKKRDIKEELEEKLEEEFSERIVEYFILINQIHPHHARIVDLLNAWISNGTHCDYGRSVTHGEGDAEFEEILWFPYEEITVANQSIIPTLIEAVTESYDIISSLGDQAIYNDIRKILCPRSELDKHTMLKLGLEERQVCLARMFETLLRTLGRIAIGHADAIHCITLILKKELTSNSNIYPRNKIILNCLEEMQLNKQEILGFLKTLWNNENVEPVSTIRIAESILSIEKANPEILNRVRELYILNDSKELRFCIIKLLAKYKYLDDEILTLYLHFLFEEVGDNEKINCNLIEDLRKDFPENRIIKKFYSSIFPKYELITHNFLQASPPKKPFTIGSKSFSWSISFSYKARIYNEIIEGILEANPFDSEVLTSLVNFIKDCWQRDRCCGRAIDILFKVSASNKHALEQLEQLFEDSPQNSNRFELALAIAQRQPYNYHAIKFVVDWYCFVFENSDSPSEEYYLSKTIEDKLKGKYKTCESFLAVLNEFRDSDNLSWIFIFESVTNSENIEAVISSLESKLKTLNSTKNKFYIACTLGNLEKANEIACEFLIEHLDSSDEDIRERVIRVLPWIVEQHVDAVRAMLRALMDYYYDEKTIDRSLKYALVEIIQNNPNPAVCKLIVCELADLSHNEDCLEILWLCAQNLAYKDFYYAFNSKNEYQKLNVLAFSPECLKKLNISSLTYFTEIRLSGLNNPSETVLIKKIWNRIALKACPGKISISVDDVGDLERELMILQHELQAHHLTILFHETDVFPRLVDICRQFTDVLHIGWVTDQLVPCANVRTFHPDSSDIFAAIQHWLNEISHEVE